MKITLVAALVLGIAISAPASARNYDCSKAGNANNAACKTATKEATKAIAKSAPKAMPAPKAAATKVSSTTTTKTTTERTFDCTKAGNKNKAVCKTAAITPSKPVVKETTTAVATRNYDCSKAGNATKQVCKNVRSCAPDDGRKARGSASLRAVTPVDGSRPNRQHGDRRDGNLQGRDVEPFKGSRWRMFAPRWRGQVALG